MDATTPCSKTTKNDDAAPHSPPPPKPKQQQAPEPEPSSSPPPKDVDAASGGEVDDEQVERFFALLANIRAMRGLFGTAAGVTTGKRKRRDDETPWRPAFRMEDFEPEEEVRSATRRNNQTIACCAEPRIPAASETDGDVADNDGGAGATAGDVVVERNGTATGRGAPHAGGH